MLRPRLMFFLSAWLLCACQPLSWSVEFDESLRLETSDATPSDNRHVSARIATTREVIHAAFDATLSFEPIGRAESLVVRVVPDDPRFDVVERAICTAGTCSPGELVWSASSYEFDVECTQDEPCDIGFTVEAIATDGPTNAVVDVRVTAALTGSASQGAGSAPPQGDSFLSIDG